MTEKPTGPQLLWFEQFVQSEYPAVRALCMHLVKKSGLNMSFCDDLVQETLYLARVKLDIFSMHPNPKGWLYKTAFYALKTMQRKQIAAYLSDEQMHAIADPRAETAFTNDLARSLIKEALLSLSPSDRLLFRQIYVDNLDYAALCNIYHASGPLIRQRVSRMRRRLAKILEKFSENDE